MTIIIILLLLLLIIIKTRIIKYINNTINPLYSQVYSCIEMHIDSLVGDSEWYSYTGVIEVMSPIKVSEREPGVVVLR